MARGKHSIALFEVITSDRAHQQRHASPLSRRARWWFQRPASAGRQSQKGVEKEESPVMREIAGPTPEELAADPTLRPISSPMRIETPAKSDPEPMMVMEEPAGSAPALPAPVQPDHYEDEAPAPAVAEVADTKSPDRPIWRKFAFSHRSGVDFDFNPDKQEVTLKMRYTTGIITAFAVLVIVGLAYIAGRSTGSKSPVLAAGTTSTDQVRKGPVHANALNIGKRSDQAAIASADLAAANIANRQPAPRATGKGAKEATAKPAQQPTDATDAPPGAIEQTAQRSIGLNYVLVQSYSDAEEAERARELLRQAGIPATVERALPIAPAKFSVVGTAGFASPFKTKPEYRKYLGDIDHVSQQLTSKSGVRRFEPMCFKWPGAGQG